MKIKAELMDKDAIKRAITRISHEILEKNSGADNLAFIGIKTRGEPLAKRIVAFIKKIEGKDVPMGSLDITLYRDDLSYIYDHPELKGSDITFSVEGKDIILCDDVLFTGRTARAAIDAIIELGRPKTIQLAVLIDRGHRELPIRADFIGKNVPTSREEIITVNFEEQDNEDKVLLYQYDGSDA